MSGQRTTATKRFAIQTLSFATLWLILAEGDLQHPAIAILAILAATATAIQTGLGIHWRIRLRGLARFLPFFINASWRGGVDVAARPFRRRQAIDPIVVHHNLQLPENTPSQAFFGAVINLLPGTLCIGIDGRDVTVHVIDQSQDPTASIREFERRVAALFGHSLDPPGAP